MLETENDHLFLGTYESIGACVTTPFERWVAKVELLTGLPSLDGDQLVDGYSLDYAYEAFLLGEDPTEFSWRIENSILSKVVG